MDSLARDDARPLAGTENASYPFWAPDSRRLAFFAGGKLKTLDTAAGLPQVIADAPNGRGGSWGDNDVILFAPVGGGAILRTTASGGDTAVVTRLDTGRGENAHYWPFVLPGSRRFLYFARSVRPENNGIYVAAMDGSSATRLVSSLSSGIYAPPFDGLPGHLMWAQDDELLAQPFDVDRGVLAGEPSPIGFQRIWVLLRREGWLVNRKRVRRLYRLEGLQLRMRVRRLKHIALHRGPAPIPLGPAERWSMDFVHDALADGRPFRVLTVVDQWSRQSPILEAASSMSGHTVSVALDHAIASGLTPRSITVDHGTEFMSRALEDWAYRRGVQLDFIRPGKPVENAFIESFNGRLRDEC